MAKPITPDVQRDDDDAKLLAAIIPSVEGDLSTGPTFAGAAPNQRSSRPLVFNHGDAHDIDKLLDRRRR